MYCHRRGHGTGLCGHMLACRGAVAMAPVATLLTVRGCGFGGDEVGGGLCTLSACCAPSDEARATGSLVRIQAGAAHTCAQSDLQGGVLGKAGADTGNATRSALLPILKVL